MSESTPALSLLSGRLLARNVIWNVLGSSLPLLVAIWSIPALIQGMGTERFGLLAIIWTGIGYFTFFDLGTGRALTKLVAERLGNGREAELPPLIHTGMALMYGLGATATLVLALVAPYAVRVVLNVPAPLQEEAYWSLLIMAATLPFVVSTAGLIGILQAHQRFARINVIRLVLGITTFLGPVLALLITPSLVATTLVLAAARVVAWLAYRNACRQRGMSLERAATMNRTAAMELLTFGGWITVSNIVGPLMVYFDRFVIGAVLSMTAVAYYTVPYEVITRLWIVPEAVTGVLFPALATSLVTDPRRASIIFLNAARVLLVTMFVPIALAMLFAPEAMSLWLGSEFAQHSTTVLRWLALGVFVNAIARLPYVALQGKGRPDLTAKLHLTELPFYVALLYVLMHQFGIAGAAAAWTLRIVADTVALFVMGIRQDSSLSNAQWQTLALTTLASVVLAALALPSDEWLKGGLAVLITIFGGALTWHQLAAIRAGSGSQGLHRSSQANP